MATARQKKAVIALSENIRNKAKGKILRKVGYSKSVSERPKLVTESKGFKELCEQVGLTDKLITSALVEDIKKKPQNRKAELELGAKILGITKDNPDIGEIIVKVFNYGKNNNNSV